MKKTDVAQMIGVTTRQHIDYVLAGKRNFSFDAARKATMVIGGTLSLWMDKSRAAERKKVWAEFKQKAKTEVDA